MKSKNKERKTGEPSCLVHLAVGFLVVQEKREIINSVNHGAKGKTKPVKRSPALRKHSLQ